LGAAFAEIDMTAAQMVRAGSPNDAIKLIVVDEMTGLFSDLMLPEATRRHSLVARLQSGR
jgi:hypothetical protein